MKMRLIQDLKITTLAENTGRPWLLGQWGLSFLLEFVDARGDDRKVVFDTGLHKEALLHNIKQLKADLSDVDCVVLSHGHADHTSATVEVVEASSGAKVYAHPHTFLPRLYENKEGKRRQIGIPKGEGLEDIKRSGGEVVLTTEPTEVVPGVWTTGQVERVTRFEQVAGLSDRERLILVVDGEEIDDQILDDVALWMDVDGVGPIVITGCAHAGPVNILLQVQRIGHFEQIHGLVGGTHLAGRSEEYLEQTVREIKRFRLGLISPCHCTGFKATTRLWQTFPYSFVLNFCGRMIQAGKEPEERLD
ncbi:MAG: MBL fold metallo-hydrolase [Candidatus Bathyarchaeota archaeon]|nr:MBL fold metallo-hydrolase [Candidatus Bathyarchaeota archaeon]